MARDAPVMSAKSGPMPPQNALKPPPVPVDSTTGAGLPVLLANSSAAAWLIGEHGRRADDLDLVACGGVANRGGKREGSGRRRKD